MREHYKNTGKRQNGHDKPRSSFGSQVRAIKESITDATRHGVCSISVENSKSYPLRCTKDDREKGGNRMNSHTSCSAALFGPLVSKKFWIQFEPNAAKELGSNAVRLCHPTQSKRWSEG